MEVTLPYRVCQRLRAEGLRSVFVRGLLSRASQRPILRPLLLLRNPPER
jgi:hypothetical protein